MYTFTYPPSYSQKKTPPRGKKTIRIVLLVLLVLIAAILIFYPKATETSDGLFSLASLEGQLTEIGWQYQGEDYTLTYQNGEWFCPQLTAGLSLDEEKLAALVNAAGQVQSLDKLADGLDDLAAYGLDQPMLRFSAVDEAGQSYLCYIGEIPGEDRYACYMEDGDGVYLAAQELVQTWQITPLSLLQAMPLCSINPAGVSQFSIRQNDSVLNFVYYPHGVPDEVYSLAFVWFSGEEAGQREPLDSIKTEDFLNFLTSLQADYICLAADCNAEILAAYGLNQPWAVASFTCQESISNEQGEETAIEKVWQISIGNQTEDGDYYVLSADGNVGVLAQDTVREIVSKRQGDFVSDDVCLIELSSVNRLTLNYQGQSYAFVRTEQIDSQAAAGDQSVLVVSYTKNGQEIDGETFESCYSRLVSLRSNIYAEGSGGETVATLRFERNSSRNFPQMTLSFQSYDDQYYLVNFNGEQRLLVERETIDSLLADFAAL